MNCANLLAFIQVAVAFDFGLVFFKDSNTMKYIHSSFMEELRAKYKGIIQKATKLIETEIPGINDRQREHRAILEDALKVLKTKTDSKQGNWGKYAYLGLFGGIYGLVCLLGIGMFDLFGDEFNSILQAFLLMSAEAILLIDAVAVFGLHFMENKDASMTKILGKTAWLIPILIVTFICSWNNWTIGFFDTFELPFLWFMVIIIAFPIVVFTVKIILAVCSIRTAARKCKEAAKEYEYVIPPLAH